MKTKLALIISAALLSGSVLAQSEAISQEEMERLQAELTEARIELAETARRMSEIQRQLVNEQAEMREKAIRIQVEGGQVIGSDDVEVIFDSVNEVIDLTGDRFEFAFDRIDVMPPRLGIVLGSDDSQETITVAAVTPGGGAAEAGIKPRDVIVSVNGQTLGADGAHDIRLAIAGLEVGDTVPVVVERNGESITMDVTMSAGGFANLGRLADIDWSEIGEVAELHLSSVDGNLTEFLSESNLPKITSSFFPSRGLGLGRGTELMSNHAGLAPYFGTDEGIVVLKIDEDNAMNLQSGDVILSVDQQAVSRPLDLGSLLMKQSPNGESVVFEVMRNGVLTQIEGQAPEQNRDFPTRFQFFERTPRPPAPPESPEPPVGLHF